jgi:hypothetical protein
MLNVGWLNKEYVFSQGGVPDAFIQRLWLFCREPMCESKGFHECEFCVEPSEFGIAALYADEELRLGSAEIRATDRNGMMYVAPNLIFHYVVQHHYRPPGEFIQAVLEGPLPDTLEYRESTKKWKYGTWKTSLIVR